MKNVLWDSVVTKREETHLTAKAVKRRACCCQPVPLGLQIASRVNRKNGAGTMLKISTSWLRTAQWQGIRPSPGPEQQEWWLSSL